MVLEETVEGMLSKNYEERFVAEYQQLLIRYERLKKMLDDWDKEELSFVPTCPRSTYDLQIKAMNDYRTILEVRAAIENINIS